MAQSVPDLFNSLIEILKSYHPSNDFTLVEKAYELAASAHDGQIRKSGEPYIIHPLSVAIIIAETELDLETVVAGILHDVIEDTIITKEGIAEKFSEEIANLVDGVTKLAQYQYRTLEDKQAENYRKMFIAMASDIRVILIKIADRLHNMRTLKFQSEQKQKEIAQETLDIYCPLADRLGISKLRYELEDLSLRYIDPDAYFSLKEKIQFKQEERVAKVNNIVSELKLHLEKSEIDAFVEGRPKHFFSIYKKMKNQNKSLDQIFDLFAVRVITNSERDCYATIGIAHELFNPIPGRFKDYIAMPKSNMYQSLHNTLIGPDGEPFELQIRTWEMHRTCEYGIAAHWRYKSGKTGKDKDIEEKKLQWLRQILEWQRESIDNKEYLDTLKYDLNPFKDNIYCFTPKGAVISLLVGSTPIDFAYAIHSAVGNRLVGAKVNGKMVNIDSTLNTGDRIEIVTSQNSKGPNLDWLKIVKTSQARTKINQWFKKENRDENLIKGRELLEKGAKKKEITLEELEKPEIIEMTLKRFAFSDWEGVVAAIGFGGLTESQVINRLYESYLISQGSSIEKEKIVKKLAELENASLNPEKQIRQRERKDKSGIVVKGVGDIDVRLSKCCSPVPGDEIVGFITRGRGVSIHRTDCVNMINLDELDKLRLIESAWEIPANQPNFKFRADLKVTSLNRESLLFDVSKILNEDKIDIKALNVRSHKDDCIINIAIEIKSKDQLERIINKINDIRGVQSVERMMV